MCGRFTLHATGRIKFDTSRQDVAALLVPLFNIAPRQDVLTVMQDGDQRVLLPARWGLIPSFRNQAANSNQRVLNNRTPPPSLPLTTTTLPLCKSQFQFPRKSPPFR